MKVQGMNNYWFAILLFLGLGLFSGCLNNGSRQLIIDEVPFQICPVELPYDLPEEKDFYFYSPYNDELSLSEENIVLPFGVVCGGSDGEAAGNYAQILLGNDGYSLLWMHKELLRYFFGKECARPQAYKLIKSDPDAPCGGDLACLPISLAEAACATVVVGREQIVVFTPREVLIKKGNTKIFSYIKTVKSPYPR